MALTNLSKNKVLAENIILTDGFLSRSKGLLGISFYETNKTLWIKRCNSIHTFFMKFNIDVVFVDKNLIVKSVHKNLPPWRFTFPQLTARSVFEMSAGQLNEENISIGDQLDVGH